MQKKGQNCKKKTDITERKTTVKSFFWSNVSFCGITILRFRKKVNFSENNFQHNSKYIPKFLSNFPNLVNTQVMLLTMDFFMSLNMATCPINSCISSALGLFITALLPEKINNLSTF